MLLAGAGQVALRRANTLLSYDAQLTVVAPEVLRPFETWQSEGRIQLHRREFQETDLEGAKLAYACTNDPSLNQKIVEMANARRIWVESCTSAVGANIFPGGIIQPGSIGIGISSMGKSPSVTQALRECFEGILDEDFMNELERLISNSTPNGSELSAKREPVQQQALMLIKKRIREWGIE